VAIRRLLVANRGEIAARVFRTCDRLGIETVAVATPDDEGALHTRRAARVERIESYLVSEELIRAAHDTGADAVHPGYGFLAESPDFADSVLAAGLVWVGPPPAAMRLAADKLEAKRIAAAVGVPTLPHGPPEEIGFPLILKATGGGGGRGMRIVRNPAELDAALDAARREAEAGFGDDRLYAERLLPRASHVEAQLLADLDGHILCLGERDCSIQRRHQKVLEESPSPALGPELREHLSVAALAIARETGYVGAGTAEFLVADGGLFFIELNARLQVEHPVTEELTGLDLVEEQLRIADGKPVRTAPEPRGHAIEARLYAEHPLTFLPQAGVVEQLELPQGIRVDAGVEAGDAVPVAYDPLIAKLVAHAASREEALEQLSAALGETRVEGVTTNLSFLRWLVRHPEVRAGRTTTAFLEEHPPLSNRRLPRPPWTGYWRAARDPSEPATVPAPPPVQEQAMRGELGAAGRSELTAPMPGTVVRVLAAAGDRVAPRQPLVVLEAMKMETPLHSHYEAVVRRVLVAEGDQVAAGALLVELEA
jgi:acetyl/propionyl-CoA carboxylase alpha subunit